MQTPITDTIARIDEMRISIGTTSTWMKVDVGPLDEERHNGIAFGMGAEVNVSQDWDTDMDSVKLKATISQGGIGGQSIETAEQRAAAFMLATIIAKRIQSLLDTGWTLEGIEGNLRFNYADKVVGR